MNIIGDLILKPRLPDILKRVILHAMRARFLSDLLARICSTQVFLIRGNKKVTNSNLAALLFGDEKFVHYVSKLVYSEDPVVHALGEITYSSIPSRIADIKADVILVRAYGVFSGFLSRKGFLILPMIRFTLDISGSWDDFYARMSRGRRRDIRAIEKIGYTYEITRAPKKFSFFYHKMYLPHISKRHGESVEPATFDELKKCFRNGGLLLVKLDGEYVSGLLYSTYKGEMQNICSGVYEGRDEYFEKGAVQVARYFLIHWSKQQGHEEIDHGLSNPFMKDGVFSYKRAWGMKVRRNDDVIYESVYALGLCNFENRVREFLADNPFVFIDSGDLKGLVFLDAERLTEEKAKKLHHSYYTPDLSGLVVISYSTNNASRSSFKSTSEDTLEKHSLAGRIPPSVNFLTKLSQMMGFNTYLIDARGFCSSLSRHLVSLTKKV